jgi:hypothetical protein
VTSRAELAPADDASGDWVVTDRGEQRFRAPLGDYRVSVLWKADVYKDEAERRKRIANPLSMRDVADVFDRDFERRGSELRFDLDRVEDPALIAAVNAVYPEAVPVDRAPSIYDPG